MNRLIAACLTSVLLAIGSQAQGQTVPKTAKPAPKPTATAPPAPAAQPAVTGGLPPVSAVELSPEAFRINSVGLSMHLPAGAQLQTTGAGEAQSTQVMGKDQSWLINIKTAATKPAANKKPPRSAESIAMEVRDQLLALSAPIENTKGKGLRNGVSRAKVLQDVKPLTIKTESPAEARPACSFYLSTPRAEKDPAIIRGYTIFEVSPGRFVTFDLSVPEPNFAVARSAFETSIATARFADLTAVSAARGAAVESGTGFLNGLNAADLDAACATMKDQWFRLTKPAAGGAEDEVAYRRVRAWKGKRGELDTARDSKRWNTEDHREGYLVRIDARMLQEGKVIDSVGTYFMTADRKEEAWLLQMVVRDPATRKPSTWRELGARGGTSMSVSTDGSGESKQAQPTVPTEGYLNQVEAFLLPQLLIHAKSEPREYGFYAYQSTSATGAVSLRRDTLGKTPVGEWTISTRLTEDSEPQVSTFSDAGLLVRTTLPSGSVWTPTTLPRLAEIWRAKGLPME